MLFKLSNLNSNLTLTLGYFNPALNNLAQLQKYLSHYTVFWLKWPLHDLVLVTALHPLIKVASNTRPCSKLGRTTLNGREEGGQCYISQTSDQLRFEAREVVFSLECLKNFATGCSFSVNPLHILGGKNMDGLRACFQY